MSSNSEERLLDACGGWHGVTAGRVRDLARRFEQSQTSLHLRSLNSFSKNARRRLYQTNEKGERCTVWPPQKPTRLRLGLYRKRSSMKRRTRSHLDVSCECRNGKLTREASCSMRKSCSNNEDLSDYIKMHVYEKPQPESTLADAEVQEIACMQLRASDGDSRSECTADEHAKADSVIRNDVTLETASNQPRLAVYSRRRAPGVKPIPPAKPARFKKLSLPSQLAAPVPPVSRPTVPPPVLPKSSACLRIVEASIRARNLAAASGLGSDSAPPATSDENNEETNEEPIDRDEENLVLEADPKREDAAAAGMSRSTEDLYHEDRRPSASCETGVVDCLVLGKTVARHPSGSTLPRSKTPATTILRRSTYLNEDIKKPKIQPPPPPLPALTSRVRSGIQKRNTFRITHSKDEVTHIEMPSSSTKECCTAAPEDSKCKQTVQIDISSPVAQRKDHPITEFPKVPSIPPPLPPKISPQGSVDDEELYEEIEQVISFPDASISDGEEQPRSNESCDKEPSPYATSLCALSCPTKTSPTSSDYGYGMLSRHFMKAVKIRDNDAKCDKKKHSFRTLRLRHRSSNLKRPMSSLEFDKLLRIKSDIQLNISKKEKERKEKGNSTFYVNPEELKAEISFPLDDTHIYGDDWSSDEEELRSEDIANGNVTNEGQVALGNTASSMLSEIEKELKLKIAAKSLPDLVPNEEDNSSLLSEDNEDSQETCERGTSTAQQELPETQDKELTNGGNEKLRPVLTGYEQITSPSSSSSDKGFGLPNSQSDSVLNNSEHSLYTPRFLPDPQPLYQIYMMEQQEGLLFNGHENDEGVMLVGDNVDKELKIRRNSSSASTDSGRGADCSTTVSHITSNTSMRRDRLVAASHFGSQRSLWCELPEVKNAGLLDVLDEEMKKLQEAFFEVITSEASYLRSLNILITHFMAAPGLLGSKGTSSVISNEERKQLFSNIFAVRDCSERLLCDLESRLEANLVLTDVCDILCEHFSKNFEPYVMYCSNQVYQDRTLKRLKCENGAFMSCIQRLESDRQCQGLDMRSFLMLPMQRVTRYPLLVIAILDRIPQDSEQQKTAQSALHLANQVVINCNEGARRMERTEQLLEIERRLVYKSSDLRRIPLVSSGRYLVKRGALMHITEVRPKSILQPRQQSQNLYLFLFSDILMITKKKLNGTFVCKDYSARRFVDIEPIEVDNPKVSPAAIAHLTCKPHLFVCILMHNARGRQTELLLNAESESDRERWLSALRPPTCSNPEEKIYADWDCPQAAAVHNYTASQDDELGLEKGDLINILRKMPDGWFYGERVRDGKGGWFPSSYVQQVLNDHVRAKNYRQRLRVIQAAADYRQQQGQPKTPDSNARRTPHLIDRFRRLSNPKGFFLATKSID